MANSITVVHRTGRDKYVYSYVIETEVLVHALERIAKFITESEAGDSTFITVNVTGQAPENTLDDIYYDHLLA